MADVTNKAQKLAMEVIAASDGLLTALETFSAAAAEQDKGGINFKDEAVEAALAANGDTKHVAGADLDLAITTAGVIKAWMTQNFHDAPLQKVRP